MQSKQALKKTLRHPQIKLELREQYYKKLIKLAANHPIVYIGEGGFKSHKHRPREYSKKGTPCLSQYNWQLKNQTNAIGAIYQGQLFAVGLFDCCECKWLLYFLKKD